MRWVEGNGAHVHITVSIGFTVVGRVRCKGRRGKEVKSNGSGNGDGRWKMHKR